MVVQVAESPVTTRGIVLEMLLELLVVPAKTAL
jgi:hypothetical protein